MISNVARRLVEQEDPSHVGLTQAFLHGALAESQPQMMQNAILKNGLAQAIAMQSMLPLRPLAIPTLNASGWRFPRLAEPFAGMAPLAGSHAQFHASSRQFRSSAAVPFARLLPEISWLERGDVYLEAGSASILAALRGRLAQAQNS